LYDGGNKGSEGRGSSAVAADNLANISIANAQFINNHSFCFHFGNDYFIRFIYQFLYKLFQ